jgi:Flp pilus assembly CpaE family ATPase
VQRLLAGVANADAKPDKAQAEQLAAEFLAVLDRGDTTRAFSMFTVSETTLGSFIDSMRAANIKVPPEIEKQRADELQKVIALREDEFERETVKRQARGRLRNTRAQWSERIGQRDAFQFEFVSDAEKPATAPGGETKTTVASIRVDKEVASSRYKIARFTTEY